LSIGASQAYRASLTDLAAGGTVRDLSGSGISTYSLTRPQLALTVAPQSAGFPADGVVNAATFTAGIAPGGILSIFGSGLSGDGSATKVEIDGDPVSVLAAYPFQINAVVPLTTIPGAHTLRVTSMYGTVQQTVTVSEVAPAIFLLGNPPVGAAVNQDGTLNLPTQPLARGQYLVLYATGLGAVAPQGQYSVVTHPVSVIVSGQDLPVTYAGLAPGTTGEYQVNLVIPPSTPPGLGIPLTLKVGDQLSNTITIAVQ
jgi:uncharacterized protein (TIGR03437 family)